MGQPSKGFIAVHVGAGKHSLALKEEYRSLCRESCAKGIETLSITENVVEAVTSAVVILENSALTNAGYGSNLTYNGQVECDASVMEGTKLHYGAVGAVSCVQNPVEVAKQLCQYQDVTLGHGRIQPSFLVGTGAYLWAKDMGIETVPNEKLISARSEKLYKHYKRKVESSKNQINTMQNKRMDTVGAICIDELGNAASACSSGGIILKYPGRVGQAGIWGCGVWANKSSTSVATTTTGCGEHLVRTSLARTAAESIVESDCPTTSLYETMKRDFIDSRFLANVNEKLGGVMALKYSPLDDCGDFLWCHTTHSMIVGYMHSNNKTPKFRTSYLPDSDVGKTTAVEGITFRLQK